MPGAGCYSKSMKPIRNRTALAKYLEQVAAEINESPVTPYVAYVTSIGLIPCLMVRRKGLNDKYPPQKY